MFRILIFKNYEMKKSIVVIFLLTSMFSTLVTAGEKKIYVDALKGDDSYVGSLSEPLRTIHEAQQRVRQMDKLSNVDVCLRGGDYWLNQPLVFTEQDASPNKCRIRYVAYKKEKPILSGGYQVSGWKLYDPVQYIYYTKLPEGIDGRQFFVNGQRSVRAKESDNARRWIKSDSIGHITSDLSLLKWKSPGHIECVYREIWTAPRCGVASITQIGDTLVRVVMKQPGWKNCRNKGITSTRTPWYWENTMELLDEEGEWYLDKDGAMGKGENVLFYKPRYWENIETSECVFPILESIIQLTGTKERKVENISFEGLEFCYTTWLRPSTDRGNPDAQNNVLRQNKTQEGESMAEGAAIRMKHAQHIVIDKCSFLHLGADGINMEAGCSHNEVSRSLFYDLAATAIQMGNYKEWNSRESEDSYDPVDSRNLLTDNCIMNNHIELCGVEYRSATGIAAVFPVNSVFKNNTLKDLPYSGFHIGWGWTTVPYTVNGGNLISQNKIQNVMIELADGGSIYTLGGGRKGHPNIITGNYMNRTMWGQGVYLDNGSAFYKVSDNVYERIDDYNVKINSGSHDIETKGIYSNKSKSLLADKCYNCVMDSTELIVKNNCRIVRKIKKNAGAGTGYASAWEIVQDKGVYELEHAEMSGGAYTTAGIGTDVFDYSGMGFVSGFDRSDNNRVFFKMKATVAGKYWVKIRYSLGNDWDGKISLDVNSHISPLKLQPSDREVWNFTTIQVDLRKGLNEITLLNTGKGKDHLFFDVMYITPQL